MLTIGDKLRAARLNQNMSLRELAEKAEVSASLLSQIENGKANPSVRSLYSIAAALSLPVDSFLPNNNTYEVKTEITPPDLSDITPSQFRTEGLMSGDGASSGFESRSHPPKGPVVCANARATIQLMGGVTWARLTPGPEESAEFLEVCYDVGASSGKAMSHHTGREFGLILEGELLLELGFERYVLQAGDSIIFDSTTPHRLSNNGPTLMRAVWVILNRD
ncbi:MAG TPA: XRE family transcriptional regulator [Anaerolineae bacterium]|nr:XRE family transcriptional regulator [Anaerolineae bacterium]HXV97068.1 XRE family transcriptional regulator [Anaerolineae bacterium]